MNLQKWHEKSIDILLLEHTDLDGYGNGIVLRSAGFSPSIVNLNNNEVDPFIVELLEGFQAGTRAIPEAIIISDISPTPGVAKKLDEFYQTGKCEVYLFDHHTTALHLNQYEWAKVVVEDHGVKTCGTQLLYQFLKEIGVPMDKDIEAGLDIFVEEVRLYDTWDWEKANHPSAKALNDLFFLLTPPVFEANRVGNMAKVHEQLFSDEEMRLLDVENLRIKKYIQQKNADMIIIPDFFTDDKGNPLVAGVVQADQYISELGHFLCNEHPEIDFALLLNLTRNKASLRATKEEVNVIPIVKKYNGGGHPKAAGCNITAMGMDFLELLFKKLSER